LDESAQEIGKYKIRRLYRVEKVYISNDINTSFAALRRSIILLISQVRVSSESDE